MNVQTVFILVVELRSEMTLNTRFATRDSAMAALEDIRRKHPGDFIQIEPETIVAKHTGMEVIIIKVEEHTEEVTSL